MKKLFVLGMLALLWSPNSLFSGGVARLFYERIPGNDVSALTASPKFPSQPDRSQFLTNWLASSDPIPDWPQDLYVGTTLVYGNSPLPIRTFNILGVPTDINVGLLGFRPFLHQFDNQDNSRQQVQGQTLPQPTPNLYLLPFFMMENGGEDYGSFIRGYLEPPQTGDYLFYIWSDDASEIYLSQDHTPEKKRRIADEPGCCRAWVPRSASVFLERGKKYYFEVLHKEGVGGDYIRIGWMLPDGSQQLPISGLHLLPFPADPLNGYQGRETAPVFVGAGSPLVGPVYYGFTGSGQPQSQVVREGAGVIFSSIVEASQPAAFQWYRNNEPIPGATLSYLALERVTASDSKARFTLRVSNSLGTAESLPAVLTVTARPQVESVITYGFSDSAIVTFNCPVNPATATDKANYSIDQGVTISEVQQVGPRSYELKTSTLSTGVGYLLTVRGIEDAGTPAIPIAQQIPFVHTEGLITKKEYHGIGGGLVSDLRASGKFPALPDDTATLASLEHPAFPVAHARDNYGVYLQGYVTAPVTGPYLFFLNADDQAELWLSTDENPDGKRRIGVEPYWSFRLRGYVQGDLAGRVFAQSVYGTAAPVNISAGWTNGIVLEAGKRYYFEALMKEGGGADHISVAWQIPGGKPVEDLDPPIHAGYLSPYGLPKTPATLLTPLQDRTVEEFETVRFAPAVAGLPHFRYQWTRDGTPIPGATNATYTATFTRSDHGTRIGLTVRNPYGSATSEGAIQVTPYLESPRWIRATSLRNARQLVARFDHYMDPASASDASRYLLSPAGPGINKAELRPDGKTVVLSLAAPLTFGGTYSLNAPTVADRAGGTVSGNTPVDWIDLTVADIGAPGLSTPLFPGEVTTWDGRDFDVRSGGAEIWDNLDGFNFIYREWTGDFDMAVQVARFVGNQATAKAGLMMHTDLDPAGRRLFAGFNPATGANRYEAIQRQNAYGNSSYWTDLSSRANPAFPNAWVRMLRRGAKFSAFRSDDGVNWVEFATTSLENLPATVFVGIASSSLDRTGSGSPVTVDYRAFSLVEPPPLLGPRLTWMRVEDRWFLAWPPESFGWVLQQKTSLLEEEPWATLPGSEQDVFFEVPSPIQNRFYRLSAPGTP